MSSSYRLGNRILTVLWAIMLVALICGCSLIPQIGHKDNKSPNPWITPIVSSWQPSRLVSVLIDTPPYFEASYFKAVESEVAQRTLDLTTVNQGGLTVFVSFLGHDSLHTKVYSITVPPIPGDPQQPTLQPLPSSANYQSPYDYADAVDKVKKANQGLIDTWQGKLRSNHVLLARVRAEVKIETDALQAQPVIFDNSGADIYGGLFIASQDFQRSKVVRTLVIASPLINNITMNASSNISLAGVSTVNVIYHSCETMAASVCFANDTRWKQTLRTFGAKVVNFFTPAQSAAWQITF